MFRWIRRERPARSVPHQRSPLMLETLEDRCLLAVSIAEFTTPTSGSYPHGITRGPDGNIWFTAATSIGRITPTGESTFFGINGGMASYIAGSVITTGPDGNLWFTASYNDFNSSGVAIRTHYDIDRITTDGHLTRFALPAGTFTGGITAGPDGNLWYTRDKLIGRITPNGQITEFPLPPGHGQAWRIARGSDGNL